ncbi:hypothetical protein Patl1_17660 [Pistacia atlantica]|uniref:Uncharacterized protein n=1 Tax=Pistacia atlantica TaxID=434234 RepID=A0ACC1C2Y5_9ROSI|nr:hypothetical protein Patl1_17660 [Pistacia atlantica]
MSDPTEESMKEERTDESRNDSGDIEAREVSGHRHGHNSKVINWSIILQLAFQSIGVVYGDIGTSPLYVYSITFRGGINHVDDILGVLSLIFYTLTLIPEPEEESWVEE